MELYGLNLEHISEEQLSLNLQNINKLQKARIKLLEERADRYLMFKSTSVSKLRSVPVH